MNTRVAIKFVRSDNLAFIIGDSSSQQSSMFGITAIDGIESPGFEIFTQSRGSGDGNIITGKRVKSREINITASVSAPLHNEKARAETESFFNPKHSYRLYVTYQSRERWIQAELYSFRINQNNLYEPLEIELTFLAAEDPYFNSVDEFGQDIAAVEPVFHFPYEDDPVTGFVVDVRLFADTVVVENSGDVPTQCRFVLRASDTVINPKIIHGDAYIRIIDTMERNDEYIIDLTADCRIIKNGENYFRKIDKNSDFEGMAFTPGDNTIEYDADDGKIHLSVTPYFYKKYLGV